MFVGSHNILTIPGAESACRATEPGHLQRTDLGQRPEAGPCGTARTGVHWLRMPEFLNDRFFLGFGIGLGAGLVLMAWVWVASLIRRAGQRKEAAARLKIVTDDLDRLRQHLHTQMEITAQGQDKLKAHLEQLRSQNENLRVTVQALQQKPDRVAARALEVLQRAVDSMAARVPGFAPAWQQAVQTAEQEVQEMESGLRGWVGRVLGGNRPPPAALPPGEGPDPSAPGEEP